MKKLTIEQKAKAYDEAIKRANSLLSSNELGNAWIYKLLPELAESEDERIKKDIISYIQLANQFIPQFQKDKWIAWLKEQGEHSDFLSKIQVGDKVTRNEDGVLVNLSQLKRVAKPAEKQGEQNLADETNFKIEEGEWYVCISQFCNCIEGRAYKATSDSRIMDDFGTEYDMHNDAYKYFRLWTIQDAKDGDVLASEDKDKVFIYNGKLDLRGRVCAYCGIYKTYDGLRFTECAIGNYFTYKEPHPATKEQRDQLEKAMADAGYIWDSKSKRLLSLKAGLNYTQNPAWSEEDEKMFNKIAAHLSATCNGFPEDEKWANEFLNWFKILKERVQFQSKQEWTKEDKDRYISCLQRLNTGNPEQPETINSKWFKEHVYPQKQWNPTEEQMKALHELNLIGSISYAGQGQILIELYNDLKKLTK